ncbi:hypothetical protein D3C78_1922770 [compost metagenome]
MAAISSVIGKSSSVTGKSSAAWLTAGGLAIRSASCAFRVSVRTQNAATARPRMKMP